MNIQLTLAARYLLGRKLRTFLTTLAVVFGVFVLFGMNVLIPSMLRSFQANMLAASNLVDVTVTHTTGEAFSPSVLETVKNVEGVIAATGYLNRSVNLPLNYYDQDANTPDQVSILSLTGLDVPTALEVRRYPVEQGRFLDKNDAEAAVISLSLAENLGLTLGDMLELPTAKGTTQLTIVGLQPRRTMPGNEEVFVTLAKAQTLLDQPDQINTLEANLIAGDETRRAEIKKNVEAALGANYHIGALASGADVFATLQLGQTLMSVFGFLALVMGGFIIFNTFRTIVVERRRDIAMLRSIGANRSTILGVILAEGLLQGVVGTAVGMMLGYLGGAGILAAVSGLMEQYVHVRLGGPAVSFALVVVTVALGVVVTLVAGLMPALAASRVSPLEALRPASLESQSRAAGRGAVVGSALLVLAALGLVSGNVGLAGLGGILLLCGLILVAPALVRPIASAFGAVLVVTFARAGTGDLAQGNLTRQTSRAAITASTTMIGLAIIVAAAGLIASVRGGFLGILKKSLGSDYLFIPPSIAVWKDNVGANADLVTRLRAVDGVGVISTFRFASTAAGGNAVSLLGIDPVAFPQVSALNFDNGDPDTAFAELASGRGLIANGPMAANHKLKVGDPVKLTTPSGVAEYRVVAIAGDYLNAKITTAYISQANLAADFNKTEDIFIQLNLAPGADRAGVEPKLKAIAADYPQFSFISGRVYYEEQARVFEQSFLALYVLFSVLAIPSLIAVLNTLAIGVIERTREIGMLRAIGATRNQVRQIVLAESLLLAAAGTALGLLAGVYLSYLMVGAMKVGGFPVSYQFPVAGLLIAIAIGLIVGVVAALFPARQAARMEIVQALRYE